MTESMIARLKEVTAADQKVKGWEQRRDAAIREAHDLGASYRDIAAACSLSHMTIKRIIEKEAP